MPYFSDDSFILNQDDDMGGDGDTGDGDKFLLTGDEEEKEADVPLDDYDEGEDEEGV